MMKKERQCLSRFIKWRQSCLSGPDSSEIERLKYFVKRKDSERYFWTTLCNKSRGRPEFQINSLVFYHSMLFMLWVWNPSKVGDTSQLLSNTYVKLLINRYYDLKSFGPILNFIIFLQSEKSTYLNLRAILGNSHVFTIRYPHCPVSLLSSSQGYTASKAMSQLIKSCAKRSLWLQ